MRNHITPDHGALSGPSMETGQGVGPAAHGPQLERRRDERRGDAIHPPSRVPSPGLSPASDFEGFGSFS